MERLLGFITEKVVDILSLTLKMDSKLIDNDEVFSDFGVDSIIAVKFIQKINEEFNIELRTVDYFDYSTVNKISEFIALKYETVISSLMNKNKTESKSNQKQVDKNEINADIISEQLNIQKYIQKSKFTFNSTNNYQNQDIAIIGISGRFAGSNNMEEYWDNLKTGKDLVEMTTRWDLSKEFPEGQEYCKYGSYLKDIDKFDPLFFNISGQEARYMDPTQRIFLEESWNALEDAGYAGDMLQSETCGVYVGTGVGDYHFLFKDVPPAQAFWGITDSIVPARISYYLDLKGPAMAVDTACSSSLVSIHLAAQSLKNKEINMAIAGGVFVQCTPLFHVYSERANMLSHYGKCQTFDDNADGIVLAEGAGAIVIKRLDDAIKDGDHIYAVIKGSAINQDGATNGITAPSLNSQVRLQKNVYDTFHINPEKIQMFEAHGTGTKLGDPIEYEALSESFSNYTDKKQYCAIGSVKTNLGHGITSAGIAGVLKIILSLQNKEIPPTLNYKKQNKNINYEKSPFYVNTKLKEWKVNKGEKRCAAINGFGFSGTNAHMVIEEAPEINRKHSDRKAYIIALSARNNAQLLKQEENLLKYCQNNKELDLGNISYTLLVGRKYFNYRFACIATSIEDLVSILQKSLNNEKISQVYTNVTTNHDINIQPSIVSYANLFIENMDDSIDDENYINNINLIAELFTKDYKLNYEKMFQNKGYSKLSLTTYPFSRDKYWINEIDNTAEDNISVTEKIHPLIHKNTSNFFEQRFTSTFIGNETFLADHVVNGNKIMPGVAYIEMAVITLLESLDISRDLKQTNKSMRISNIVWMRPIIANDKNTKVSISLTPKENGTYKFVVYGSQKADTKVIYCEGHVSMESSKEDKYADLDKMVSENNRGKIESPEFYKMYDEIGINYGPGHRGVNTIYLGDKKLLIRLSLPKKIENTRNQYILHPSLMDAAFQGSLALIAQEYNKDEEVDAFLPYQLDNITVFDKCNNITYALLQYADNVIKESHIRKIDITLFDASSKICAVINGLCLKELETPKIKSNKSKKELITNNDEKKDKEELIYSTPMWDIVKYSEDTGYFNEQSRNIVITNEEDNIDFLKRDYKDIEQVIINSDESIEVMKAKLNDLGMIDHIIWFTESNKLHSIEDETIIIGQDKGVIRLLKFIQALLALKYGTKKLHFTVITVKAQSVLRSENINPTDASIHGLVGSMQKEMPIWKIKLIDVEDKTNIPLQDIFFKVPVDWNTHAYRKGQWYEQKVVPITIGNVNTSAFKNEGVYVIIGGSGGLGEVLSQYLVRKYNAHIIWIGRREKDEDIQHKIDNLSEYGFEPMYIRADSTNKQQLENAYKQIKDKFQTINGIVHSAAVLQDKSLYNMDEKSFRTGLSAKVDICVRLAQVFKEEKLDFILFYSSYQSFIKAPGQSNYAAGCVFKDNFALQLLKEWSCKVKIVNWSYWGEVGMVASEEYRKRMLQVGMSSISSKEGMDAIEKLLAMPMSQLAVLKTNKTK